MNKRNLQPFYLASLALLLSACSFNSATPAIESSPLPALPSSTEETQVPIITDEPLILKAFFIADPDTQLQTQQFLLRELQDLTAAQGWALEVQASYPSGAIDPALRVVVALPPAADIEQWADQSPEVQFVAIGVSGVVTKPNLSLIGPGGFREDQLAFLAGYLAAVITPDWRIGTIVDEGADARAAGFRNGMIYFCGLCQLTYPPYYDYPLSFTLKADHSENEWRQAAEFFAANEVDTLFINVSAHETEMPLSLSESGLTLFGSSKFAGADPWLATLRLAPEISLREQWNVLVNGDGGWRTEIPLIVEDVDQELLSIGRLQWIEKLIDELQTGFIDPSVTPISPD